MPTPTWSRFSANYREYPALKLALDTSSMAFADDLAASMASKIKVAFETMARIEAGEIENPTESQQVGHYWLRNPSIAPPEYRDAISKTVSDIKAFTKQVHEGELRGNGGSFRYLLMIGIGGSALGPQFVADALTTPGSTPLDVHFFDNTDPDGMDRVLSQLDGALGKTLCVVISKSGGTKETANGMLEAQNAYERAGLEFAKHAVAITVEGSKLHQLSKDQGWLTSFPIWKWVGGRTSVTSAVGLLPAALLGLNIEELLAGASACDEQTRSVEVAENPAAQLALMWHYAGSGKGEKDMVVLPYKDRLVLFPRYLQQLVMESLGKKLDLRGQTVNQGLVVYGNKGSTDQHAYVQQLCDGTNNFFVTFIEVLRDRAGSSLKIARGEGKAPVTAGDYLEGFLLGSRQALASGNRESITLTIDEITPFTIGVLIALYERAVGLYAAMIGINAYDQPGVEAGKLAAEGSLDLQEAIVKHLTAASATSDAEQIATALGTPEKAWLVFKICNHLSANGVLSRQGDGVRARFEPAR